MNKRTWNKLPADLQEILRVAMRTAAYDMYAHSYHESALNLEEIEKNYKNVQIKSFPEEVMTAMRKANTELLAEKAAKDPLAKEILDSQANYMKKVRRWTEISDKAYLNSIAQ